MREGIKRGHDIIPLNLENANMPIAESDFVVLSNVSKFDPKKLMRMKNRYAVFHHDYWFQCKWRLFFPLTEKCLTDCPQSPVWKPLMERANLHIFLSPLHYQMVKAVFGEAVEPHVLVPSAVDPDDFIDYGRERHDTCAVNSLLSFKGRENVLKYAAEHPDEKITFAGTNEKPDEKLPDNCSYVGEISDLPGKMTEFFNKFETFLHLPSTPMPFDRLVVEAYLSGCKLRLNSLVGAASWPWMSEGRQKVAENVRDAPKKFWDHLEGVF